MTYGKKNTRKARLDILIMLVLGVLSISATIWTHYSDVSPMNNTSAAFAANAPATPEITKEEYPQGPLQAGLTYDKLYLEKSERRLTAYSKGKTVRVYLVALGEAPVGHKQFQGDRKTPEGRYTIDGKNPNSGYYKNLGVSYPNAADKAYAAKYKKSPGGDIKIHGLGPTFAHIGAAHRAVDWTWGCIAVTNPEMEELYTRTPVGTPIEIVP